MSRYRIGGPRSGMTKVGVDELDYDEFSDEELEAAGDRVKDTDSEDSYEIGYNSFLVSGDFCPVLITLTNSLDPDQDRQNVGPDLDPNCLTL